VESDGLIGQRFGRYRIVDVIGRGGMATVYRAVLDGPLGFSRSVAIKQIRTDEETRSERFERALVNEARLGSRLGHPNLVDVLEFGQEHGSFYIVMELVEGMALGRVIERASSRDTAIPRKLCLQVLADVAAGLAYAHGFRDEDGEVVGLIHRDLKPANILVSHSGQVLIADFGLAKSDANLFQSTSIEVKGTPAYMSPEQVTCKPLTPASDLFSLGTVLYELLRGEPLFAADNVLAVVHRVSQDPMEEERRWVRSQAPEIAGLFEQLIAKDPTERPASAEVVAREARELLRGYPAEVSLSDFMDWLGDDAATADSVPDAGAYVQPTPTVEDTQSTPSGFEDPAGLVDREPTGGLSGSRWGVGAVVTIAIAVLVAGGVWFVRSHERRTSPDEPITAPAGDTVDAATPGAALEPGVPPAADGAREGEAEIPGAELIGSTFSGAEVMDVEVVGVEVVADEAHAGGAPERATAAPPPTPRSTVVASLKIDCRPWCDRIEVEGEVWGESPQLKREAAVGRRELRLHAARGDEKVLEVDVQEGGTKVCWDFDRGEACEGF